MNDLDVNQLLVRAFEMLRMHQEALFRANLAVSAAVEALKEEDPRFEEAYEKHFWELKQGRLGEENAIAVRMIDHLKAHLRDSRADAASGD